MAWAQPGKRQWRMHRMSSRRCVVVGIAVPAPFVHRVADVVIDGQDQGGITRHPAHGVHADQAVPFEFTRELRGLINNGGQWHVGHDGEWRGRVAWRPRGTDDSDEHVAESLVPRCLAV